MNVAAAIFFPIAKLATIFGLRAVAAPTSGMVTV